MDIDLLIPATITQLIVEAVKVMDMGILRPASILQVITYVVDVGQV